MEGLTQFCDDAEVVSNCTLRVVLVASKSTEREFELISSVVNDVIDL